ncbi:rod shape-determining protein RodA [Gammaproteobacteria bacterium]|nr:rod shape-determining protein RodA [Gammaproteobacteria bacterium]
MKRRDGSYRWHLFQIDIVLLVCCIFLYIYSSLILYSASGKSYDLVFNHSINFCISLCAMLFVAQISVRSYKHFIPIFYVLSIFLLIILILVGDSNMGATRWLDLGIVRLQPSEIIKFIVPMVIVWSVSRYQLPPKPTHVFVYICSILVPAILVINQPDLGTAIIISMSGFFVLFLAGISYKFITMLLAVAVASIPILWKFVLLDYQKNRIINLFNPEYDTLGSGWNIIQSKIAVGSGGLYGKGWLHGTQSHLDFLPESHTDFILSVLAEEFGLLGILALLSIYLTMLLRILFIALHGDSTFEKLLSGSILMVFFSYIFINISMVTGILPVVGVPLPLFSYGGSSMFSLMLVLGILMSTNANK